VHALFNQLGPRLDVEGVLGDVLGDAQHVYQSPCKIVFIASEEVNELAFLFHAQTSPDLDSLGRVLIIDLDGLGVLSSFEGTGHRGHGQVSRRGLRVVTQLFQLGGSNSDCG
jgi:hypothetical protein